MWSRFNSFILADFARRLGRGILVCLFIVAGCSTAGDKEKAPLRLKPVTYSALPGWSQDNHQAALDAFLRSCVRILGKDPTVPFGPDPRMGLYGDWYPPCQALMAADTANWDSETARAFFESWFIPYEARAGRDKEGLFTGYYEASLHGSRTRHGAYQYPLYARPDDLVMVDLGEFRDHLKGERIAGRVVSGRLRPYEERAAIEEGRLPAADKLVLYWVDDPVDVFFLHIQGSGRVLLDDGSAARVGYAGQNGHPYYAIGRELIAREALTRENVSMQAIRAWLDANPAEAQALMNLNKSYVFFRPLEEGPLGAENTVLTAGRSLAVDRTALAYGIPLWLVTEPISENYAPVRRLMVAQDTGGAIRGAVRGDVFWGYGAEAEERAGVMKARGRYWLLLPRTVSANPPSARL